MSKRLVLVAFVFLGLALAGCVEHEEETVSFQAGGQAFAIVKSVLDDFNTQRLQCDGNRMLWCLQGVKKKGVFFITGYVKTEKSCGSENAVECYCPEEITGQLIGTIQLRSGKQGSQSFKERASPADLNCWFRYPFKVNLIGFAEEGVLKGYALFPRINEADYNKAVDANGECLVEGWNAIMERAINIDAETLEAIE